MYIIELIIKKLTNKKEKPSYDPMNIEENEYLSNEEFGDENKCEHTFMPVDSTNEILACTKCGILKKRSDIKGKNIFDNNIFTRKLFT